MSQLQAAEVTCHRAYDEADSQVMRLKDELEVLADRMNWLKFNGSNEEIVACGEMLDGKKWNSECFDDKKHITRCWLK